MMIRNRDESIETLRAIAIILVLGIHISADPPISVATNVYAYLSLAFQNIRMPLFTFISGYLYAQRRVKHNYLLKFFEGKARRLLVPLIFVSLCEFASKSILPGVNNPTDLQDIWKVVIYPYEHYWFVQVILVIFLIVGLMDAVGAITSYRKWLALLLFSLFIYLIYPQLSFSISFFSIGRVTYLLPFFLLGYGLVIYPKILCSKKIIASSIFIVCLGYIIQNYLWFSEEMSPFAQRSVLGLLMSMTGPILLFYYRRPVWGLSFIGSYAFTIYLYQGFALSLGRRLVEFIPYSGPHVYFLFVVGVGVMFGIAVTAIFSRVPVLRTLMLGIK